MALGALPAAPTANSGGGQSRRQIPRAPRPPRDPNAPEQSQQQPTDRPQRQPQSYAPPQRPQTFAEMQQSGQARPAPPPVINPAQPNPSGQVPGYGGSPQASQVRGQLQQSVTEALQNPSRYNTESFNAIKDPAMADLQHSYDLQREGLDENLASRGLYSSTIGANKLHDLGSAQSRDMASLNAQLLTHAADTQAADRSAAYGMGSDLAGTAGSQDLAQYNANANAGNQSFQNQLNEKLGLGGLTGKVGGEDTLAAKSLAQSGKQFDTSQALAEKLGVGGLDLQGKALAQSGTQFDASNALARELGTGGLALQKQQADQSYSLGNRANELASRGLDVNQYQFNAGIDQQRAQQQQQASEFNTQQALARELGTGNLALNQQQLVQQGKQFEVSQALAAELGRGNLDVSKMSAQAQADLAKNDFLLRILGSIGALSPEDIARMKGTQDPTQTGGNNIPRPSPRDGFIP